MSVEVVGAIAAGVVAGSLALIAFGGDSFIELISGIAVLSHLRTDDRKSEVLGDRTALLTSGLLFALLPVLGGGAVYSYIAGIRPESSPTGIALAACAVAIMPLLFLEKRRIGRETRCLPLSIDAYASATCLFVSAALLGGLLVVYLTGLWWVDYAATGIILAFVAKEAIESLREASKRRRD
jgi:divalent metal cation (Fe/Co/Zn/Cd) transporter